MSFDPPPIETSTTSALKDKIMKYINIHYLREIRSLFPNSTFTMSLDSTEMTDVFIQAPNHFVQLVKECIIDSLCEYPYSADVERTKMEFKDLQIRLTYSKNEKLSRIKPKYFFSPVCFNATVIGVDNRMSYIDKAYMICPAGHGDSIGFYDVPSSTRELPTIRCASCGEKMEVIDEQSGHEYLQRIVLQEPLDESEKGNQIDFDGKIIGDLVGDVTVGEKKQFVGLIKTVFNDKKNEQKLFIDVVSATSLEDHKENMPTKDEIDMFKDMASKENFFDLVARSYAPSVFDTEITLVAKKAITLALIGGIKTENRRGFINVFLVGDPSVAKSTMLEFGEQLIPKSMYTTGKGASAAGLTIGMVKRPDGTMIAQAGVLPLCHGGVAFVDELDKMNDQDRVSLHDAMEKQKVRIAKSGNIIVLPAETAVIAAANPKGGKYDVDKTVLDNIDLTVPLLSRFDVKLLMVDRVDEALDQRIAERILSDLTPIEEQKKTETLLSIEQFRKLIAYVRPGRPVMTLDAMNHLTKLYNKLRAYSDKEKQAIIDPRQLEGLSRLAAAHAKLHQKDKIDVTDVDVIFELYLTSLESFGFNLESNTTIQSQFFSSARISKENMFWTVWSQTVTEDGWIESKNELVDKLSRTKPFMGTTFLADQLFNRMHDSGQIYMDAAGRYKKVNR